MFYSLPALSNLPLSAITIKVNLKFNLNLPCYNPWMFRLTPLLLAFLSMSIHATPSAYEQDVLNEMNAVRVKPTSLVPVLQELYRRMDGKFLFVTPTLRIETQEGAKAVSEAIRVLGETPAAPKFEYSALLSKAARDHQRDQERTGQIGHFSSTNVGPSERAERYVILRGKSGENVSYGDYGIQGPKAVPVSFIVDDGVADRGHRRNLFDPEFLKVGIACGPHAKFQNMCVVDFAHDLKPRK